MWNTECKTKTNKAKHNNTHQCDRHSFYILLHMLHLILIQGKSSNRRTAYMHTALPLTPASPVCLPRWCTDTDTTGQRNYEQIRYVREQGRRPGPHVSADTRSTGPLTTIPIITASHFTHAVTHRRRWINIPTLSALVNEGREWTSPQGTWMSPTLAPIWFGHNRI